MKLHFHRNRRRLKLNLAKYLHGVSVEASWSDAKRRILCVKAIDGRVKLALKAFHSSDSIINIEALMDINDSAALLLLIW